MDPREALRVAFNDLVTALGSERAAARTLGLPRSTLYYFRRGTPSRERTVARFQEKIAPAATPMEPAPGPEGQWGTSRRGYLILRAPAGGFSDAFIDTFEHPRRANAFLFLYDSNSTSARDGTASTGWHDPQTSLRSLVDAVGVKPRVIYFDVP